MFFELQSLCTLKHLVEYASKRTPAGKLGTCRTLHVSLVEAPSLCNAGIGNLILMIKAIGQKAWQKLMIRLAYSCHFGMRWA